MVLGILIATITAPGLLGSQEAIRQGQSKDKREEHRARRCNLIATCVKSSPRSREINGRPIVLRNGKLWIDTTTEDGEPFGHTYAGYYLPYPDTKYEGLVTTITDVAPIMNWVYIDRETHEVKYGVRADAQPNLTGPFDCTRQDRRLTFDGWEGWCAVEEYEGYWSLHFDVDDDGLKSKVAPGIRVLEIELSRKEKRFKKDKEARQQDQTTQRAVETKENTPVDRPLQQEPEVKRPGVFQGSMPESESANYENPMPKTPPPAYSKSDKSASPQDSVQRRKGAVDALDDFLATEAKARLPDTPPRRQSGSPPSASQATIPLEQRRVTPKLNRNSGSKAIAQAQMFEAMAAEQSRNDVSRSSKTPRKERTSLASSADSASVYSKEDREVAQDIRPQSSVSQRADTAVSAMSPAPTTQSITDPAVFQATNQTSSKRSSQTIATSQRKRYSRTFAARRPGKRVSPRTSIRKSLTDTMSSGTGRRQQPLSSGLKVPTGRRNSINRTQAGRKTTSTFLRDLDDLVSQEAVSSVPKSDRKTFVAEKRSSAKRERVRSNGQAKQSRGKVG